MEETNYFRVIRLAHWNHFFEQLNMVSEKILFSWLSYNRIKVSKLITFVKLILFLLLTTHILACCWIAVGMMDQNSWIPANQLSQATDIYIWACYFILTVITTVGYGDGAGSTQAELIFCMFIQILGLTFFSLIMGTIGCMFTTSGSSFESIQSQRADMVDIWLLKLENTLPGKTKHLPVALFRDIKSNIQDALVHDFNLIRDEFEFFDQLSSNLQNEIIE